MRLLSNLCGNMYSRAQAQRVAHHNIYFQVASAVSAGRGSIKDLKGVAAPPAPSLFLDRPFLSLCICGLKGVSVELQQFHVVFSDRAP